MSNGYIVTSGAALALSAATARTMVAVVAAANVTARLVEFGVSFDGVTSTAIPVLVELCDGSGGAAGTSTSQTPRQIRGNPRTVQCAGANTYTAGNEPTTLTVIKQWLVHPQTGIVVQFPLGREPEHAGAGGLMIRLTAPATVNARGYLEFEEG